MASMHKLFVELFPYRHKLAMFVEEMLSIVEQDKHRSISASQAQAAPLLGVTPNTWARWERGDLQPHLARTHQLR